MYHLEQMNLKNVYFFLYDFINKISYFIFVKMCESWILFFKLNIEKDVYLIVHIFNSYKFHYFFLIDKHIFTPKKFW